MRYDVINAAAAIYRSDGQDKATVVLFDESVLCYVNRQITDLYKKAAVNIHDLDKGDQVWPAFTWELWRLQV